MLHESAALNWNRIREVDTAKVCRDPMGGRRHSKDDLLSGLRTHWRAEIAEAAHSIVGSGNNRSVSHVSQPQEWSGVGQNFTFWPLNGCRPLNVKADKALTS